MLVQGRDCARIAGSCLVLWLLAFEAHAVAGFSRQTGMTCNQCHTLHGAPTPNFTFTGKKFNAMGYRLPGEPHTVQERIQEQGEPDDQGEFFNLLPTTWSGRMQWQAFQNSKPPGDGDWGEVITNPTSRLSLFPFIGPIGKHFGVWTEIYLVPLTSEDSEWGIADTTYEEMDFRYIFNPDNHDYTIGLALSNQGAYSLFGFGPFPGLPSYVDRGGVGGYSHPNKAQVFAYGWMFDRWVWATGADSGDTNYDWDKRNFTTFLGYALKNRNDNELWLNFAMRTGDDALPLVTANGAEPTSRSWQYRDSLGGVSDTRRPPGTPCIGEEGRRPEGSCAYLAEELDEHTSMDMELRYGRQNVGGFFGQPQIGPWSFEFVSRIGRNTEDYIDGAEAERHTWGAEFVLGWRHRYYLKPSLTGDFDFEFTDVSGVTHDIDTDPSWGVTVAYKPVENFLIYLRYNDTQRLSLDENAEHGRSVQMTADLSF